MKAIFMGTPDFAVPALEKMIEAGIDVALVVTKEDKPKGRGQKLQFSEVKEVAISHDIEVFNPRRIKNEECVDYLRTFEPDVIVVVAYGQILSKEILEIPKYGVLNIHGSILPKYRGPAPIHRAVINGDSEVGITIMYVDEALDSGDIIKIEKINITEEETTGEVYNKLKVIGAEALVDVLKDFEKGVFERTPQDHDLSTYAPLIEKNKCQINFDNKAVDIKNFVRGLYPFPKSYTYLDGVLYKIGEIAVLDENVKEGSVAGEIFEVNKDELKVNANDKLISIKKIQKQGSKEMAIGDFLRGNKLEKGQKFEFVEN